MRCKDLEAIKDRLKAYKKTLAEKRELEFKLLEARNESGIRASNYDSKNNSFISVSSTESQAIKNMDIVNKLERLILEKDIELQRIDNALSVLDDKERKIIELKHIKSYSWETVSYQIDRSSKTCKNIERQALLKMDGILNLNI